MNVRIIIPLEYREANGTCPVDTSGYLSRVATIAGGYTSFLGQGGFIVANGSLCEEPVLIADCTIAKWDNLVNCAFRQLAKTIAQELHQECVFLSFDGKAEFVGP